MGVEIHHKPPLTCEGAKRCLPLVAKLVADRAVTAMSSGTQFPKEYHAEYQRKRHAKRKAWALELLGGKCAHCGTTEDLQFDHIDRHTKLFEVSVGFGKYSIKRLENELSKCQLLCASCHIIKTAEELRSESLVERHARGKERRELWQQIRQADICDRCPLNRPGFTLSPSDDQ